ncbi:MAG: hypothetical protein KAV87_27100 [Desulfobacteraceae bacterium]|nr:hypothetical protein [Desulfobacteraceae bacterium]
MTKIDLTTLTKVQLAEHFNNLLDNKEQTFIHPTTDEVSGFRPIKTFASCPKGIERIEKLEAAMAADDSTDDGGEEVTTSGNNETAAKPDGPVAVCKSIFEKHCEAGRGVYVSECETAGINKSTAATQWQRNRKENGMAEETKAPGKCAQIRTYCDENKTMERKDICKNLIEQGFAKGTVQVQVGKWFKENPQD